MGLRRIMLFTLGAKIKELIQAFKTRVLGSNGKFEAESCLETQLNTLNNENVLDNASLVITPNGYKENILPSAIPLDGSGDMDVTRATTGTRVNSDGLIEMVPYNLLGQTEAFTFPWIISNLDIENYTPLFGNSTAKKFTVKSTYTTGNVIIQHSPLSASLGDYTFSVFVKNINAKWILFQIDNNIAVLGYWVNMENYTLGSLRTSNNSTFDVFSLNNFEIIDYPDGWKKIVFSVKNVSSSSIKPTLFITNTNGTLSPATAGDSVVFFAPQLVQGTQPKDYYPTTDRLDIPRIDYSNGSCPSILIEPQSTNLILQSENFTITPWTTELSPILTVSNTTNPLGIEGAYEIEGNGDTNSRVQQPLGVLNGNYSYSCFIKSNGTQTYFRLKTNTGGRGVTILVNADGTMSMYSYTVDLINKGIYEIGNGWYRVYFSTNIPDSSNFLQLIPDSINGIGSCYIWGAQVEADISPTSYIPTTSATVTRNRDIIGKTSALDLIGQTEGTIFLDFYYKNSNIDNLIYIHKNTLNYLFRARIFNNNFYVVYFNNDAGMIGAGGFTGFANLVPNTRNKVVVTYSSITQKARLFCNGAFISETTTTYPFPIDQDKIDIGITYFNTIKELNNVSLWKYQITDEQAINLTTL
jgi:hypothetical protein